MTTPTVSSTFTAYLAADGFLPLLQQELSARTKMIWTNDRLVLAAGSPVLASWAQNIWYEPEIVKIASIGDAAKMLRAKQRDWWPYSYQLHRRTNLIQEKLPHSKRPRDQPESFPLSATDREARSALGSYCLLDEGTMLFAPRCRSRWPNGEISFNEKKVGPPSRAYLKLWEAFTRSGVMPRAGESCLELGASPGGWTWVLGLTGAKVTAIDRAPLAPEITAMHNVHFREGDAFASTPDKIGAIDWLFSDLICYPEKLYEFVMLWLRSGQCRNAVCTLKFQGDGHYGVIADFAAIPGSQLLHLSYNKHELTWIYCRDGLDIW